MSKTQTDIRLPAKRVTGDTLEEKLTDNAFYGIMPSRYADKDEDGEPIETPGEVFERVAKNIALAELAFDEEMIRIQEEWVRDDMDAPEGIVGEPIDENTVRYLAYDDVVPDISQDSREYVESYRQDFEDMMTNLDWLPNSPTIMNAGDELQQLSACFVDSPHDDMENIFDSLKEAALVMQSGGGMGYAFSYLRPYGDIVGSSGGIASGPISFMRNFDQMCQEISQGGTRRGAQMGVMRCTHPDVPFFIHAKNKDVSLAQVLKLNDPKDYRYNTFTEALEEARSLIDEDGHVKHDHLRNAAEAHLANFNISVTVTDEFMEAAKNDEEIEMINPRTGEPHIATEETKELYEWFGMDEHVEVGEPLTVPAQELLDDMADGAWENGEPGILFIDRANEDHSFPVESTPTFEDNSQFELNTTNPCGEQWLMEYEACNLGHINLSTLVDKDAPDWRDHKEDAQVGVGKGQWEADEEYVEETVAEYLEQAIDWDEMDRRIELGTRFLDNVITMSDFPVEEIEETVSQNRKIGLGIMGLAQMFIQMGIRYGSEEANEVTRQVMRYINQQSKDVSHRLTNERGPFGNWEESKFASPTEYPDWFERQTGRDPEMFEGSGFPIRNHNTTTIAPTGTTGMVGNTSGGCEPIHNVAYRKNVGDDVQGDEQLVEFDDYFLRVLEENDIDVEAVKKECVRQMDENEFEGIYSLDTVPNELAELFVSSDQLTGIEHASVQCAAQEGVDSSISKTVNFPNSATVEDVQEVMMYLYDHGAKGGTLYRDGSRSKQVISTRADHDLRENEVDDAEEAQELVDELLEEFDLDVEGQVVIGNIEDGGKFSDTRERPKVMSSRTERMNTGYGKLYVTVSFDEDGDPFEVFGEIGKSGGFTHSMVEGLCRTISLALRSGVPVQNVIDQLGNIRAPEVGFDEGEQIHSVPDAIAKALRNAIEDENGDDVEIAVEKGEAKAAGGCPKCGAEIEVSEGCKKCGAKCGWSEC